jgi:NAD(P)H-hydrate epimerase
MATAGMGDVLSGIIAAFLAQGLDPLQAAQTGVLVHSLAAEEYARNFDANSLIASDVIDRIAEVTQSLKKIQQDTRRDNLF